MKKAKVKLVIEFFLLFILIPVSLPLDYPVGIKAGILLLGFVYVIYVLLRVVGISFKVKKEIAWTSFWKRILRQFIGIALLTSIYVYMVDANKLFCVPLNKPLLWVFILFIYSFLSVWPQEILYRTFFFTRYESLFSNKKLFIFINAIVFSLAHLFFKNTLVLVLTFLGGLLFAYTFVKTKSTSLVTIEHAVYGNWLFTVGMGDMLAFPGQETC